MTTEVVATVVTADDAQAYFESDIPDRGRRPAAAGKSFEQRKVASDV